MRGTFAGTLELCGEGSGECCTVGLPDFAKIRQSSPDFASRRRYAAGTPKTCPSLYFFSANSGAYVLVLPTSLSQCRLGGLKYPVPFLEKREMKKTSNIFWTGSPRCE